MGTAYFTKTKHDGDPPRLKSCDYKCSQNLLQDSLHEGASTAVASLLQRKLVPVAIHEASRLGRNREAWDKKGTSPFGLGVSRVRPTKTALAKKKGPICSSTAAENYELSSTSDLFLRVLSGTRYPKKCERVSASKSNPAAP